MCFLHIYQLLRALNHWNSISYKTDLVKCWIKCKIWVLKLNQPGTTTWKWTKVCMLLQGLKEWANGSRTEEDEWWLSIWEFGWVCCREFKGGKAKAGGYCGETAMVGLLWQQCVNDGFSGDRLSCAGKIKWCASAPGQGPWVWMRYKLSLLLPDNCLAQPRRRGWEGVRKKACRCHSYGDVSLQRGERSLAWLFARCALKLLWLCGSSVGLKLSDQLSNYLSAKFVDMLLCWSRKLRVIKPWL